MKSLLRNLALSAALVAVVGCGGGGGQKPSPEDGGVGGAAGGGQGGTAGPDGGTGGVTLVGWVDDLVVAHSDETSASDTVEDKVGVIIDTDDPAAFDPLLQSHAQ